MTFSVLATELNRFFSKVIRCFYITHGALSTGKGGQGGAVVHRNRNDVRFLQEQEKKTGGVNKGGQLHRNTFRKKMLLLLKCCMRKFTSDVILSNEYLQAKLRKIL